MTRRQVYLDALLEKVEPLPKDESGRRYHVMIWIDDVDVFIPIRGMTVGTIGATRIVEAMEEINESVGHMAIWGVVMPIVRFRRA